MWRRCGLAPRMPTPRPSACMRAPAGFAICQIALSLSIRSTFDAYLPRLKLIPHLRFIHAQVSKLSSFADCKKLQLIFFLYTPREKNRRLIPQLLKEKFIFCGNQQKLDKDVERKRARLFAPFCTRLQGRMVLQTGLPYEPFEHTGAFSTELLS
jgi:hypothetical protein